MDSKIMARATGMGNMLTIIIRSKGAIYFSFIPVLTVVTKKTAKRQYMFIARIAFNLLVVRL